MATSTLGRYEFDADDELGQGGMATVFLARDPFMKRKVAIKVMAYRLTGDAMFEQQFKREAMFIAGLEHPSIVPLFDAGMHRVQPFIVMRYMSGGSLQDRLRSSSLATGELATIVARVAAGLDAAHARGTVHRDVKPSNILFDNYGEAFLADFGLATNLRRAREELGKERAGTPGFMSPEQIADAELDGRTDVYALGATIFRALTGHAPEDSMGPNAPAPDLRALQPDLKPGWQDIVARAMAPDPADRYPTAGALAAEVSEVDSARWFMSKLTDF